MLNKLKPVRSRITVVICTMTVSNSNGVAIRRIDLVMFIGLFIVLGLVTNISKNEE